MTHSNFRKHCYMVFQLYGLTASAWEGTRNLVEVPLPRRKLRLAKERLATKKGLTPTT